MGPVHRWPNYMHFPSSKRIHQNTWQILYLDQVEARPTLAHRGGNGSDADRIVPFPYPFSHFQNEYGLMLPNMNTERMLLKYEYGSDVFSIRSGYEYKEIIG